MKFCVKMITCRLCTEKEATKTGSHILPFSLIKEAINFEGSTQRDKEILVKLSSNLGPKSFIGRGVLPEQKDETINQYENIIKEENNISVEDFIFCPECEAKFSVIESCFSNKIINKVYKKTKHISNLAEPLFIENADQNLVKLYVSGLFWRCSISATVTPSFKMKAKDEKTVHKLLLKHMKNDISTTLDSFTNPDLFQERITFAIFFTTAFADPSEALIHCHPASKNPYFLIANRFAFLLSVNGGLQLQSKLPLYGFSKINVFPLLNNKNTVLMEINHDYWFECTRNLIQELVSDIKNRRKRAFVKVYKYLFRKEPSEFHIANIMNQFASLGGNYNFEQEQVIMKNYIESLPESNQKPFHF